MKAVFFDRDGVINARILDGYVRTWEEFHFLPGVGETLRGVKKRGYGAVVVTNQRGVGKGLMTAADLADIHARMQAVLLRDHGAQFDWINACTDVADESGRRKPSPAMLLEARDKLAIELEGSWMIGDTASDIEAGRRAGTKTAFLLNDHEAAPSDADITVAELTEILRYLL